jgi:hypothetical protein
VAAKKNAAAPTRVVQINFQVPANANPGTYFFVPWVQFVQENSTTTYQPPVGAAIAIK